MKQVVFFFWERLQKHCLTDCLTPVTIGFDLPKLDIVLTREQEGLRLDKRPHILLKAPLNQCFYDSQKRYSLTD